MSNIRLFSDRLIDTPVDANYMEEIVAVFATPSNSYSAVLDPIDLVCSRGGDLSMLEILTETEDSKEAKERVSSILEEHQKTLRFAMSKPQIQFVLYETHSELEAENMQMVDKTLTEINYFATTRSYFPSFQFKKGIELPKNLLEILVSIINDSFEIGIFPECLKTAIIIPLYKGGEKSNVCNYKPIALLSVLYKIIERCIKDLLMSFLVENNI